MLTEGPYIHEVPGSAASGISLIRFTSVSKSKERLDFNTSNCFLNAGYVFPIPVVCLRTSITRMGFEAGLSVPSAW